MISIKIAAKPLVFFFLLIALFPWTLICSPQNMELPSRKQDLFSLERKLFELINEERQKNGLHVVSFSPDLSHLARTHSQDMASRGRISHSSTDGRSYMQRLVDEGFYFIAIGENVAFSNGYMPELIHQSLMESQGHRENILDPKFDQVGIGAVLKKNKGYFITQDFRKSPVLKDEKMVKREIQRDMNALRRINSLVPLNFFPEADEYAHRCSLNMIKDLRPPPLPRQFGDTQYHFITSPALEGAQAIYKNKILDENYETAGLGVAFGRNEKYPGGSYFITLLLFPENKYRHMSLADIKQIILHTINELRESEGHNPLKEDKRLVTHAEKAVETIFEKKTLSPDIFPMLPETTFLYFITQDPSRLSGEVRQQIEKKTLNYKRNGIGVLFRKNEDYRKGAFWVLLIFGK
jgi:uncharacterized protein YkwD